MGTISVKRYPASDLPLASDGGEAIEQRFGAAAQPGTDLQDRAVARRQGLLGGDGSHRVADRVQRVGVGEVLDPGAHAFGSEQRLLAAELPAQDRRIVLGGQFGDAVGGQAAGVQCHLGLEDLLRLQQGQRLLQAIARHAVGCRAACDTTARGHGGQHPPHRHRGNFSNEPRTRNGLLYARLFPTSCLQPDRPEHARREPPGVLLQQIAGVHEARVEQRQQRRGQQRLALVAVTAHGCDGHELSWCVACAGRV
jgi:hypothetical protein